jgi:hypothetical protein
MAAADGVVAVIHGSDDTEWTGDPRGDARRT